jgi:hypothetical protein
MGSPPYDRLLPLGERPTQFHQGDILQLPDPLSGHSEFLSNFFEGFRLEFNLIWARAARSCLLKP